MAERAFRRAQRLSTQPARRALLAGLALSPMLALAAPPKAERWDRWTRNDPAAPRVLNHTLWTQFLGRYVVTGADGIARVRYSAVSSEDRGYLRVYLDQLQRTEVSKLRPDEQLAYWINLYNAHTVKLVLERYPLVSILSIEISPGLFAKGPWGANMLKVEDETLSLDDIEHRILRPIWHDPRTAYALCRGAIGSPNLGSEAYTASNADVMLDGAARAFVNHPRGARIDAKGRLQVSSLYEWLRPDFGAKDVDVIAHLRQYASPALAESLANLTRIGGDTFDWKLNDEAAPSP